MNFLKKSEPTVEKEYKEADEEGNESYEKEEVDDKITELKRMNTKQASEFDKLEEDSWENIKSYDDNKNGNNNNNDSDSDDDDRDREIPKPSFKREVSIIQADGIQYIVPVISKRTTLPPINPGLLTDKTYPDLRGPNQPELKNKSLAPIGSRLSPFTVDEQGQQGHRKVKDWAKDHKPIIIGVIVGLAIFCIAIMAALIATATKPAEVVQSGPMLAPILLNTTTTTTTSTTPSPEMFVLAETMSGHSLDVVSVIKLANGNIASCSWDTKIKIWSLTSYSSTDTLVGHLAQINAITQLANGNLVSVSQDSAIKIWDLGTSSEVASLSGHAGRIETVIQLTNGKLATGAWDKFIKIWDLNTNSEVASLSGHISLVSCLYQLADGTLASGSYDKTIKIWSLSTNQVLGTLSGHDGRVLTITQITSGKLVSGSYDATIKIWDLNGSGGSLFATLTGHNSNVNTVIQLSDGLLASGSTDMSIKFWNVTTRGVVGSLVGDTNSIWSLNQLSDGRLISSSYQLIKIWNKNY